MSTEFDSQPGRKKSTRVELSRAQMLSDDGDLADGLRGLATLVAGPLHCLDDQLAAVARLAAHAFPGVEGAGVTVIEPKRAAMGIAAWAVTAPFVREIDVLQYVTLQEGPCVTCMQKRVAQVSGSLSGDRRWPRFGARVGRAGVASALALPLLIDDQVIGSINCYAYAPDSFGEHAVRLGTQFAGAAAVSVYNAQMIAAARHTAEHLQRALINRTVIDQAIGLIRGRTGATAEDAFDRLRRISQTENTKLHLVARQLVEDAVRRAQERHHPPHLGNS